MIWRAGHVAPPREKLYWDVYVEEYSSRCFKLLLIIALWKHFNINSFLVEIHSFTHLKIFEKVFWKIEDDLDTRMNS